MGPGAVNEGYVGNSIRTAKYNIITFVPYFLWTMIKRVAYLYFFFQASTIELQCIIFLPWIEGRASLVAVTIINRRTLC